MTAEEQVSRLSAKSFGSQWAPARFLADYGPGLACMPDTCEFDFRHEQSGARIELKAACCNRMGSLVFQYIRPDGFDLCICLGWREDSYNYWIFHPTRIQSFLVGQHRGFNSFQLRLHAEANPFWRLAIPPGRLRLRLDRKARSVARHRRLVRLDPTLVTVGGWQSVASSIGRQLKQCGLSDWQLVLRPLRERMNEPELLPYPEFFEVERRVELQVHPEPVIGAYQGRVTAAILLDLLIEYLDRDGPNSEDAI
jgi:hypothetical protein